jgi:acyl-CoA hydrolase
VKYTSAEQALQKVKSGQRVFVHGSAATPQHLVRTLINRHHELKNVEIVSISTFGKDLFDVERLGESFFINSLFVSDNVRDAVNHGHGDYIPIFLSEIPKLFEKNILKLDVALIHVSPPDKHGFCTLGVSVDIARSAVRHAKHIIAQVNPQMPRTHGDTQIHVSEINDLVGVDEALPEVDYSINENVQSEIIGRLCADLIEDGSTLQMGIGSIPDEVLRCLGNHRDLGIHTEMFSDGIVPLVEKGVITNKFKRKHRGKLVTGFAFGSKCLYDFVDDNPEVAFLEIDYVNDTKVIRANPKVCAINSAIEIDLTGQICSDSIGTYQYSGVGGQIDFMRGAALSENGKPIIAMPSTTSNGDSKIVPFLKQGAGVVYTRAHVHYVITEYGVTNLFGKNLRERAEALRDIAHPKHRDQLDKAIHERFGRVYA